MWKKILKILVIVVVAALVIMQFFRIDKTNPPVVQADSLEAAVTVPDNVRAIMKTSCDDCHTNNTVYPWYSNVAPMSWFLKNHIDDGRKNLNFSVFNTYAPKKKVNRLEGICKLVESKEMPLPSYLWIHRDAILTDDQSKILCDWAKGEEAKIVVQ
jgi:hypothetical protein